LGREFSMSAKLAVSAIIVCVGASSGGVTLSASMTVDNVFSASISTDPVSAGAEFLSGEHWPTTFNGSVELTTPGTYYLNIRAEDVGRPAMFIGAFSLSSDEAAFANGSQDLLTAATSDWSASLTSFGGPSVDVIDIGPNGTSPWGNFAAMGDARFIWVEGAPSPLVAYFTTVITVVPAPGALASFAAFGLVSSRRRR
jgi:hypothetical protein